MIDQCELQLPPPGYLQSETACVQRPLQRPANPSPSAVSTKYTEVVSSDGCMIEAPRSNFVVFVSVCLSFLHSVATPSQGSRTQSVWVITPTFTFFISKIGGIIFVILTL